MAAAAMAPKSFTFVRVPATNDDAMEERTLPVPATLEANLGCLTSALQQYFREHGGTTTEAGEAAMMSAVKERMAQQKQQMVGGADAPSAPPTQLDQKRRSQLTARQTVDIIQLLPATKASGYVGVNMYVDDKGQSKGSPINARASAICTACGLPTEVRGDAFVAKLLQKVGALKAGLPWESGVSITPLPEPSKPKYLEELIAAALGKGAALANREAGGGELARLGVREATRELERLERGTLEVARDEL